jgi:hypothetical protein
MKIHIASWTERDVMMKMLSAREHVDSRNSIQTLELDGANDMVLLLLL